MGELSAATVGLAFTAGILSVLSPCVMPLMPAYLSLISGISVEEMQDLAGQAGLRRRVMVACVGFVLGFSMVFVLLGASATLVGRHLKAWDAQVFGFELTIAHLAGVLIIVMGLHVMGVLRLGLLYRDHHFQVSSKRASFLGTFLVGGAFAFGWSPCVGPILGGILTVAGSQDQLLQGMGLLAVYSAGLAIPFLAAGWSVEIFFRSFHRLKHHFRKIEIASGALLVAVGVLVATNKLSALNSYFGFLTDFVYTLEQSLL